MKFPQSRYLLLLLLALLALLPSTARGGLIFDDDDDDEASHVVSLPASVPLLDEDFDARVFPTEGPQEPWMIFFYAPWCRACKSMMPLFLNASEELEASSGSAGHAHFAVVNTETSRRLGDAFQIERFPTIVYTTGRGPEYWYRYDGGYTAEAFGLFAKGLMKASLTGSYAADVSAPAAFAAEKAALAGQRVPFYVFVPKGSSSTPENQKDAAWNSVINSAASVGNVQFAVIYEAHIDEASTDADYVFTITAARACVKAGRAKGPAGEVLLSVSDRYRTPQCFQGAWMRSNKERKNKAKRLNKEMSAELDAYITINGYRALEELNPGMFASFEEQPKHYLGLIMVNGSLDATDTGVVTVIRDMAQDMNERVASLNLPIEEELKLPRVSWAYVDVGRYPHWLMRFRIQPKETPVYMIVDARRDRMFRLRTRVPAFEAIKEAYPWKVHGEQQTLLEKFTEDVLADVYYGEKVGLLPKIAEYLSHIRGFAWLYRTLRYEDMLFVVMVGALSFFTFLIILAVVVEPIMERYDAAQAKKRKTD